MPLCMHLKPAVSGMPSACALPVRLAEVMSFEHEKDLLLRWRDLVLETGACRLRAPAPPLPGGPAAALDLLLTAVPVCQQIVPFVPSAFWTPTSSAVLMSHTAELHHRSATLTSPC